MLKYTTEPYTLIFAFFMQGKCMERLHHSSLDLTSSIDFSQLRTSTRKLRSVTQIIGLAQKLTFISAVVGALDNKNLQRISLSVTHKSSVSSWSPSVSSTSLSSSTSGASGSTPFICFSKRSSPFFAASFCGFILSAA